MSENKHVPVKTNVYEWTSADHRFSVSFVTCLWNIVVDGDMVGFSKPVRVWFVVTEIRLFWYCIVLIYVPCVKLPFLMWRVWYLAGWVAGTQCPYPHPYPLVPLPVTCGRLPLPVLLPKYEYWSRHSQGSRAVRRLSERSWLCSSSDSMMMILSSEGVCDMPCA